MKKYLWIVLLLLLAGLDLLAGHGFSIPDAVVFWKLRFPRMLAAVIGGASLALSGAQMQALFRNPLADPHIMGVSGGAGLGAAIAALAFVSGGSWTLAGAAFLGAAITGAFIIAVASKVQSAGTLLLAGVMLGFVISAISSILQYSAGEESLKLFYSWMAGSFSLAGYPSLAIMGAALVLGFALSIAAVKDFDLVLFGDEFAGASGVSLRSLRIRVMICCALMTGVVTAFCGPLGFVGIAAPHLVRKFGGTAAHRKVLPWSLLSGACLCLSADILSHLGPVTLPSGSTMALVGIPLIIVLLWRNRL